MRYIDADALEEAVNARSTHPLCEWDTMGVLLLIDRQPTADVAEVRHGCWMPSQDFDDYYCSVCGRIVRRYDASGHPAKFPYCQYCGARMDLDDNTEGTIH